MWEVQDTTIYDTPPGVLVPAEVSAKLSLDDQVDKIVAQCARAKPLGEVVVLPPVDCETPLSFTVFDWPRFTNFTCYQFDAYKKLGGHQLYEACHHNLLAPFEVPYYTPSNASSNALDVASLVPGGSGDSEGQTSIPITDSTTSSEKVVPSVAVMGIVAPSASMAVDVSPSNAVPNATVPSEAAIDLAAPKVLMAPLTPNASPNTSKVGLVIGHCNHKLEWLAGEEFTCQQYDVIIYQRCGQVTSVPSNVQNCTSVLTVSNKGQDSIVLYEHLVRHYDDGGLHRIVAYIPGEPNCGAHSTCDATRPLTECTCLAMLQSSLRSMLATPNVSYAPLNGHIISMRATSWVALCDEVGNFTGVATHTNECNDGSLSWITSMRSMFAVSRGQIFRRPKAVYERMVVQLDSQVGRGAHWWRQIEERMNGMLFDCSPFGWLRNDTGVSKPCMDWGPNWCRCAGKHALKHTLPAPPCGCSDSGHLSSDAYHASTPNDDCLGFTCSLSDGGSALVSDVATVRPSPAASFTPPVQMVVAVAPAASAPAIVATTPSIPPADVLSSSGNQAYGTSLTAYKLSSLPTDVTGVVSASGGISAPEPSDHIASTIGNVGSGGQTVPRLSAQVTSSSGDMMSGEVTVPKPSVLVSSFSKDVVSGEVDTPRLSPQATSVSGDVSIGGVVTLQPSAQATGASGNMTII
ncbi:hypothetical protein CYMTET_47406 [Cymbomonas tetramitiformis]|uniref:Uncharacterized protein n=1 Tax=Cymbomonas tetramitiformis TaxID=36881 RepID=A0AAE0EXS4_9CHLO|nr:hypothetical protein CYMTET_47406 [Cymbomonas tetramitiformis]